MDGPNRVLNSRIRVQDKKGKSPQRSSSDIVGLTSIFILRGDCVNRRKFLQNCSLAPLMALSLPRLLSSNKMEPRLGSTPPSEVYVFLHGLMLLQFKTIAGETTLVVTAPKVLSSGNIPGHEYKYMRLKPNETVPEGTLAPAPNSISIDHLLVGAVASFDSKVTQFSAAAAQVGEIRDDSTLYAFRLVLPRPKQIRAFRWENLGTNTLILKGNKVGTPIRNHISANGFSLVTCLVYDNDGGEYQKYHLYAEPSNCSTDKEHTNHALQSTKSLFTNSDNFDIQIDQVGGFCVPPVGVPNTIITQEDSYHLCEVPNRPINCHLPSTGGPLCSTIGVTNP